MERYSLNDNQDDLLFSVDNDRTMEVDEIHKWWSVLANNIKKYGTADPVKQKGGYYRKNKKWKEDYRAVKNDKRSSSPKEGKNGRSFWRRSGKAQPINGWPAVGRHPLALGTGIFAPHRAIPLRV